MPLIPPAFSGILAVSFFSAFFSGLGAAFAALPVLSEVSFSCFNRSNMPPFFGVAGVPEGFGEPAGFERAKDDLMSAMEIAPVTRRMMNPTMMTRGIMMMSGTSNRIITEPVMTMIANRTILRVLSFMANPLLLCGGC